MYMYTYKDKVSTWLGMYMYVCVLCVQKELTFVAP